MTKFWTGTTIIIYSQVKLQGAQDILSERLLCLAFLQIQSHTTCTRPAKTGHAAFGNKLHSVA